MCNTLSDGHGDERERGGDKWREKGNHAQVGTPNATKAQISCKICPFIFCWFSKEAEYESKKSTCEAIAESG